MSKTERFSGSDLYGSCLHTDQSDGHLERRMATVFRPTDNPACAPLRGSIATESCRLHRIALARRSGKIAGIAGVGAGTFYRHAACREGLTTSADLAILVTIC